MFGERWTFRFYATLSSLLLLSVGTLGAVDHYHVGANPSRATCETSAHDLPSVVPRLLVLEVRGDGGEPLASAERRQVEHEMRAAIAVFPFGERIVLDFGHAPAATADVHVLPYRVLYHTPIRSNLVDHADGKMCGNLILNRQTTDPAFNTWKHVHELGHFFGLSHEDGTYMLDPNSKRRPETDRFNQRQEAILAGWDPGADYMPHWVWKRTLPILSVH